MLNKLDLLENAQKVDTIVFDKTGTLTYGKLKISAIKNYSDMEDNKLLQMVGSVEKKSTHPIGKAFTDYLEENKIETLNIENFENMAGLGIKAEIENDEIILGNAKILSRYQIKNEHIEDEKKISEEGNSIIYVVKNKEIIAIIGVNDIVRENTKEVISDVLPSEKAKTIKELKEKENYVMMCGDGINDSPALASSDIGVSIKDGCDIAMGIFKPIGISINQMIASFAMVFSSITVICNSLRLKRF